MHRDGNLIMNGSVVVNVEEGTLPVFFTVLERNFLFLHILLLYLMRKNELKISSGCSSLAFGFSCSMKN